MGGSQSNGSKLKPLAAAAATDSEFKPSLARPKKKRSSQREHGGHKGPVPHNHFILSEQVVIHDDSLGVFLRLPHELILHCISFLDENDVIIFSRTSRGMFELTSSDVVWKGLYKAYFWSSRSKIRAKRCCYKGRFIQRYRAPVEHERRKEQRSELARLAELSIILSNGQPAELLNARGVALFKVNRYREAIEDFSRVLATRPTDEGVLTYRGAAHFKLERYAAALADFSQVLRLVPHDPVALNNMGCCLFRLARYDDAIAYFAASLEAKPNDPVTHNFRGCCFFKMGRYADAEQDFAASLRARPQHDETRKNLRDCHRKLRAAAVPKEPPLNGSGLRASSASASSASASASGSALNHSGANHT